MALGIATTLATSSINNALTATTEKPLGPELRSARIEIALNDTARAEAVEGALALWVYSDTVASFDLTVSDSSSKLGTFRVDPSPQCQHTGEPQAGAAGSSIPHRDANAAGSAGSVETASPPSPLAAEDSGVDTGSAEASCTPAQRLAAARISGTVKLDLSVCPKSGKCTLEIFVELIGAPSGSITLHTQVDLLRPTEESCMGDFTGRFSEDAKLRVNFDE